MTDNKRETGPRLPHERNEPDSTNQNAAMPVRPDPHGLVSGPDESEDKLRQSDGVNPARGPDQQTIPASRPPRKREH
jgi:hypothetical protein